MVKCQSRNEDKRGIAPSEPDPTEYGFAIGNKHADLTQ